jgi:hypothetical protein
LVIVLDLPENSQAFGPDGIHKKPPLLLKARGYGFSCHGYLLDWVGTYIRLIEYHKNSL